MSPVPAGKATPGKVLPGVRHPSGADMRSMRDDRNMAIWMVKVTPCARAAIAIFSQGARPL